MIDYTDIDAKLEEYSDVFDFYMDKEEIPETSSPEDILIGYMKDVIDNNPQVDFTDPLWVEIMKDNIISYFARLLEIYRELQLEAMKELAFIQSFQIAGIEQKREMWKDVIKHIEDNYSKFEVNLPGYVEQFKTENRDAIFQSLTNDWKDSCISRLETKELQVLQRSKRDFELSSQRAGTQDYEERKKVEKFVFHYPQLKEIIEMIGREQKSSKEEMDKVIYKFMPTSVSRNHCVEEIDRVSLGNNLERVMPVEFAMPEDMFFKKYLTKGLQELSSPGKDKPKKIESTQKDPRLNKGPIIVSVDTSGSMDGRPLQIAFSLLRQLIKTAKSQKRPCFLITYSVRAKSIDLAKPQNWGRLENFLTEFYSGGTDGEEMFKQSLEVLNKGTYEMADVLIISDLQFPEPITETQEKIEKEKTLGTKFYALQIGKWKHSYDKILDKIWVI
ncbi:MAG: hypothetical protein J1E16_02335 [Muribaculaceae bacterium]|nr:hypothetical protein [Muribaculaceae bacterium]